MVLTANSSTCPVSGLNFVRRFSSVLNTRREAASTASSMAVMMTSGSMPLSRATASMIVWSGFVCCCVDIFPSELNFQVRALHERKWNPVCAPAFFEQHRSVFDAGDAAGKCRLFLQRLARYDFRKTPDEPPIICLVAQRPVETRRRHLEGVLVIRNAQGVSFDIEHRAQVVADARAVLDGNPVGRPRHRRLFDARGVGAAIEHDPEHHAVRLAPKLHVKDVEPVVCGYALCRVTKAAELIRCEQAAAASRFHAGKKAPKTKKWARAHSAKILLSSCRQYVSGA